MDVEAALGEQARACAAMGSPMYAELLDRLAEDHAAGGVTTVVLSGHEDDPGPSALALRLLGSVHRLVLDRRAGEVGLHYPSVGGTWTADAGPAAVLQLLAQQPELVREWLDRPPQTNEVGRAAALLGALTHLPDELRLPVRLVELGASGGLNLLADRFRVADQGDPASPVQLQDAWAGRALRAWPDLHFVETFGCDPRPIDATTTEGRLALTAYVWADQRERLERLRGALSLVTGPLDVRRCGAADLLDEVSLRDGAVTVVWHSVMWQYLGTDERERAQARLGELGASATSRRPLVHVAMEPTRRRPGSPHECLVTMQVWPCAPEVRVLGVAAPHGVPVVWE